MAENDSDTANKIIDSAVELMQANGFNKVSMKDIAVAAGICEMTVFRHFSNKKGVLEAVIQKCSFVPSMREIFENKLVWDLEKDLLLISTTYQQIMEKNKTAVLILMREKTFLSVDEWEKLPPYHFKKFMLEYLGKMESLEKIGVHNKEAVALSFIAMNFGFFYAGATLDKKFISVSTKTYIEVSVQLFVKGLKR